MRDLFDSPRGRPALLCVAMLGLDHFERVNDAHGHQVDHRVLEAFGKLLHGAAKGNGVLAARYGGEEFLLLPGFARGTCRRRDGPLQAPRAQPRHGRLSRAAHAGPQRLKNILIPTDMGLATSPSPQPRPCACFPPPTASATPADR